MKLYSRCDFDKQARIQQPSYERITAYHISSDNGSKTASDIILLTTSEAHDVSYFDKTNKSTHRNSN